MQATGCAPLASAFSRGLDKPAETDGKETIAEGIAIARPARGAQVLAAVRDTGGHFRTAHAGMARAGLYVEPTAAVCWAAVQADLVDTGQLPDNVPDTVAPLSGSGFKAKPPVA